MFHTLIFNFTIIISFLFLVSILLKRFAHIVQSSMMRSVCSGLLFGLLGIILMYYSIRVTDGIIIDLRHVATILAAVYGGFIPSILSAGIISIFRIILHGITDAALIAFFFMLVIGLVNGMLYRLRVSRSAKFHIMNLISLGIVAFVLAINGQEVQAVLSIYLYTFFISFVGGFFIIRVAEYLYQSYLFEERLIRMSSRLTTLIKNLQSGILLEDEKRTVRIVNQTFCTMFHLPVAPEQLVGHSYNKVIKEVKEHFRDSALFEQISERCIAEKDIVTNIPIELKDKRHVEVDFVPIYKEQVYFGHFWNFRDVTERAKTMERLENLSYLDGLTQISNRRYFDLKLEEQMQFSLERGTPLSLILFDIDYFKKYNDTYGHNMGDQCLIQIAQLAEDTVGSSGDVCRFGGEEFGVILPETTLQAAQTIAYQLQAALNDAGILHESSEIASQITISIGITSVVATQDMSKEDMIERADVALYASKAKGRNAVSVH